MFVDLFLFFYVASKSILMQSLNLGVRTQHVADLNCFFVQRIPGHIFKYLSLNLGEFEHHVSVTAGLRWLVLDMTEGNEH